MGMRGVTGMVMMKKLRRRRRLVKQRKRGAERKLALLVYESVKTAGGNTTLQKGKDDGINGHAVHMVQPPIKKELYTHSYSNEAHNVQIFAPCKFHDLGLAPALSDHLHGPMGFPAPTMIQQLVIPVILSRKDVLVKAETGTGKTVAYLAPIVHRLQANTKKFTRLDGTLVLVLVPTRELCLQIYKVTQQLVHRFHWLVPGYLMGGENRLKEKARLRKGINLLVATPGRLLDHLKHTSSFRYSNLRWLILDEADRLLDLGLGKDIEAILEVLRDQHISASKSGDSSYQKSEKCQHVLLSATLNEQVDRLACLSLVNPTRVGLESSRVSKSSPCTELNLASSRSSQNCRNPTQYLLPAQLSQSYITVPCNLRLVMLLALLWRQLHLSCKVVVFFSTCDAVDFHYALVNEFRWNFNTVQQKSEGVSFLPSKSFRLHGNMSQQERTATFHEFLKEKSALLLCTDVVARGLDIPNVSLIIQYDSPGDAVEYVHRVGRTARLGQKGETLLFLQPCELEYCQELHKHGVTLTKGRLLDFLEGTFNGLNRLNQEAEISLETLPDAMAFQRALEAFISKEESLKYLATDAFRSYVRAYGTYRGELRRIFQVKKLHLGHVAASFALCESPSLLGKSRNKQTKRKAKDELARKFGRKKGRFHSASTKV